MVRFSLDFSSEYLLTKQANKSQSSYIAMKNIITVPTLTLQADELTKLVVTITISNIDDSCIICLMAQLLLVSVWNVEAVVLCFRLRYR